MLETERQRKGERRRNEKALEVCGLVLFGFGCWCRLVVGLVSLLWARRDKLKLLMKQQVLA